MQSQPIQIASYPADNSIIPPALRILNRDVVSQLPYEEFGRATVASPRAIGLRIVRTGPGYVGDERK